MKLARDCEAIGIFFALIASAEWTSDDTDVYDKSAPAEREQYLKDFLANPNKPCIKISLFAPENELQDLRTLCHKATGDDSHLFIITQALPNIIEL